MSLHFEEDEEGEEGEENYTNQDEIDRKIDEDRIKEDLMKI